MLLCLDRDHRLAYVLGEVFRLTGQEGGEILGISPAAFRQRLSRARRRLHGFMEANCGVVNPANPCRCARRVTPAIRPRSGRSGPPALRGPSDGPAGPADERTRTAVREMERLHGAAELLRGHPRYAAPETMLATIRGLLDASRSPAIAASTPDRQLQPSGASCAAPAITASNDPPSPGTHATGADIHRPPLLSTFRDRRHTPVADTPVRTGVFMPDCHSFSRATVDNSAHVGDNCPQRWITLRTIAP